MEENTNKNPNNTKIQYLIKNNYTCLLNTLNFL